MNLSNSLNDILLPTDFSDLAGNALKTAIEMCKRHSAKLHLLHVVENTFLVAPSDVNVSSMYVMPEMENVAGRRMQLLKENIKTTHHLEVETHLAAGTPSYVIRDKAEELMAELIIMGTHGTSGFREFFIGSNAYAVIKNTNIPVLTVPGDKPFTAFKKILFPLRISKGIREKYDFILPIIEKNNASLIVAGLSKTGEVFNKNFIEEEIAELSKLLTENGTTFKTGFHECKNIAGKVLELAAEEGVDLIVINATLDYKWRQFFIGPYAQQIVHHSKTAVLSIRTPNAASALENAVKEEMEQMQNFKLAF